MKILFVLHSELDSNSGYHVDIYASGLVKMGHEVMVSYAGAPVPVNHLDYRAATHLDLYENTREHLENIRPGIICAWTPREIVRLLVEKVRGEVPEAKLVIHYEDNEELLTETFLPEIIATGANLRFYDVERGRRFVDTADAFTFVVPTLEEIVPVNGRPFLTVGAPFDDRLFQPRPRNDAWRRKHHIPDDHVVVVYPGNVHMANRRDVETLYEAVSNLARSRPVTLVRTGRNPITGIADGPLLDLGPVSREEIPEILAAADLFIQPGRSGPFDNYRFPSKVPEMVVTGRPLICPDLPFLDAFADREEVFKAPLTTAAEISEAVHVVMDNPHLHRKLAAGAVKAAVRNCSPDRLTRKLGDFLESVQGNTVTS